MKNAEKFKEIFKEFATEVWAFPEKDFLTWLNAEYEEPTTKNNLGVDCISRADAIKAMQNKAKELKNEDTINGLCGAVAILYEMPSVTPQEPRWIPLTKRPMTDEEREYYKEWSDVEGAMIFDCPLPEDGQEVLVSYGGYVCVDTFCKDDGCYFEGVDIDDVDAWMPLPAPFEPQESEGEE